MKRSIIFGLSFIFTMSVASAAPPSLEKYLNGQLSNSQQSINLLIRTPSATLGFDAIRPAIYSPNQCDFQRGLDQSGISSALKIHQSIGEIESQVEIYSSEYCRSSDTANLVFPNSNIRSVSFLNDACFNTPAHNKNNNAKFVKLLSGTSKFNVIFAHHCNVRMILHKQLFESCNFSGRLEPAQGIVVKSKNGELEILECFDLFDWK